MYMTKTEMKEIIDSQRETISELNKALDQADQLLYKIRNPSGWTTHEDILFQAMYLHSKWRYQGLV
jgi:hypothetical protein